MFIEIEDKSSILVVDPQPELRAQLDQMLNGAANASLSEDTDSLSFLVKGCESCAVAIDLIRQQLDQASPFNLLFVESRLIDGNGLELISKLWHIDGDLHVVLCSADADLSWQSINAVLGESDQLLILQKPYSQLELRQIVHAMLRKWQLGKQSQQVMKFLEQQINLRTQEIEEANNNLRQSEKLVAVGQLAAGIAHEINTPAQYVGDNIRAISDFFTDLTGLINFYRQLIISSENADWLAKIDDQEQKADLEFILQDAPQALEQSLEGLAQIVRIVQAMKGFSHSGQTRAANININLALENTLLVTRNSYKYIADVVTEYGDIPPIECYSGELNQVFLNIIVNAAQAIEDSQKGHGTITIKTLATSTGVEIRISDTGTGIPESIKDRIYDPFFTTKDVGRGTGQGLNIAYRIIHQQHGGNLSFESEANVGTTFIIQLNRQLPPHK